MTILAKDSEKFSVKEFTSVLQQYTLKGKKALVTGAAGGLGRSTAQAFAELGADVSLMDIPQKLEQLTSLAKMISDKYGVKAIVVTGDVSDEQSVKEFVAKTVDELGTIDVLHNNAGIIMLEDSADVELEKWNRMVAINLNGVMLVGRTVANVMIDHQHGGAIINTASMSGHIINRVDSEEYGFAYTTTKAAVLHLTRGMAANYIKHGIRVNSISPGVVISGIHDYIPVDMLESGAKDVPIKRFGTLDEIAGVVAFLATDLAGFMVGSDVLVDGGQCIN
jgi:sorbose reductase